MHALTTRMAVPPSQCVAAMHVLVVREGARRWTWHASPVVGMASAPTASYEEGHDHVTTSG